MAFRLTGDKIRLTENDVEAACVDLLRAHRHYPLRQQSGRFIAADREVVRALQNAGVRFRWVTVGEPGIPDYVIPRWFVEVKAPGGEVSQVQRQKISTLAEYWGLTTAITDSVDELAAWLARQEKL